MRECAGLIRANDGGAPQGFDARQALDQGMTARRSGLLGFVFLPEAQCAVDQVDQLNGQAELRHLGEEAEQATDP